MAEDFYGFDGQSVRRIRKAVIRSEKTPTNRIPQQRRKPTPPPAHIEKIRFKNTAEQTAPYGAVMKAVGHEVYGYRNIIHVERPDDELGYDYLVNTGHGVEQNGYGWSETEVYTEVLYDPAETPAAGDLYGPIPDEWYCGPDTALPIFKVLGVVDSERKILLARLTDNIQGIGKANETIANRASGSISIWRGTFGSEEDTEVDVEMFNLGPEVEEDDWVQYSVINSQFCFAKLCS